MDKKKRLRNQCDKLWKQIVISKSPNCEVCNKEPTITGHHFFPKGLYGHLRFEIGNGIPIGIKCHFFHHHRGDPTIHQTIIEKRGNEWYETLKEKAYSKPQSSYQTTKYYEDILKDLKNI